MFFIFLSDSGAPKRRWAWGKLPSCPPVDGTAQSCFLYTCTWQKVDAVDIELKVPAGGATEAGTTAVRTAARRREARRICVDSLTLTRAPASASARSHSTDV